MGAVVDELAELLRSFSSNFTSKVSHVLSFFVKYKHASSVGAIAGVALAIFCSWRYFRNLRSRINARRKPHDSGNTRLTQSQNNAAAGPHGTGPNSVAENGTELRGTGRATGSEINITQATQRGQISLKEAAQVSPTNVLKTQLNGGRKMTCQMLGVVLEEINSEDLQNGARIKGEVVEVLQEISKFCDLYLLARVLDDSSEVAILSALEDSGLFSSGTVNREKILFCSSNIGVISFVRQLEPDWHVDSSLDTVSQLKRFVRNQLWISPSGLHDLGASVVSTPTLGTYFGFS